jgi:hypothetical protein
MTAPIEPVPARLVSDDVELIDLLVRHDRAAVSTPLLVTAGIEAAEVRRHAVLSRIAEAACWAQAEGTIDPRRAEQIARHLRRAFARRRQPEAD